MRRNPTLQRACLYALLAALLCALSPIAIPLGAVPISLSLFLVLLCGALIGVSAWIPIVVYLALGSLGLPVFAGGMGGFGVLVGPTGGYLWSYVPIALVTGALYRTVRKLSGGRWGRICMGFAVGACGLLICYLLGTLQYSIVARISFFSALLVCVVPFVLIDIAKALLAYLLALRILQIPALRSAIDIAIRKK